MGWLGHLFIQPGHQESVCGRGDQTLAAVCLQGQPVSWLPGHLARSSLSPDSRLYLPSSVFLGKLPSVELRVKTYLM